jgi:hypothetical protein
MRLPVIALVLLVMAGAVILAVKKGRLPTATEPAPSPVAVTNSPEISDPPISLPPAVKTNVPVPAVVVTVTNSPDVTAEKVLELQALAMNDDAASLNSILAELANPDPQIRAAAREAAVQFGDAGAATALRAAVEKTDEDAEKIALLEAARFLELPSLRSTTSTNLHPSKQVHPVRPATTGASPP